MIPPWKFFVLALCLEFSIEYILDATNEESKVGRRKLQDVIKVVKMKFHELNSTECMQIYIEIARFT